jgi:hypothetical protein
LSRAGLSAHGATPPVPKATQCKAALQTDATNLEHAQLGDCLMS